MLDTFGFNHWILPYNLKQWLQFYLQISLKLTNLRYTSDNNTKYSFDLHYRYPGSENQTSTFWQVMSWLSQEIKGSVLIMLQNPIRGHCKSNTLSSGTKESTNVRSIRSPKLASQSSWWLKAQFYIQLVNRPHFGTWILLLGPFW